MTPAFIYIFVVFVSKNREKINKKTKNWPLCRVLKPKHSAKWPAQISNASSLPSAKVLALGKVWKSGSGSINLSSVYHFEQHL
jgi:hypothetical protein